MLIGGMYKSSASSIGLRLVSLSTISLVLSKNVFVSKSAGASILPELSDIY